MEEYFTISDLWSWCQKCCHATFTFDQISIILFDYMGRYRPTIDYLVLWWRTELKECIAIHSTPLYRIKSGTPHILNHLCSFYGSKVASFMLQWGSLQVLNCQVRILWIITFYDNLPLRPTNQRQGEARENDPVDYKQWILWIITFYDKHPFRPTNQMLGETR